MDTLIVDLLVGERQLFLNPLDFIDQFTLIERLLCYYLSLQVLDLRAQTFLNSTVLLAHYFAPDAVKLIQYPTDAALIHLTLIPVTNGQNGANCFGRNPVVVFCFFRRLSATLYRVIVSIFLACLSLFRSSTCT